MIDQCLFSKSNIPVPIVEQKVLTRPEHMSSPLVLVRLVFLNL